MSDKLDVKIGTQRESIWTTVKKQADTAIEDNNRSIEVQKEIAKLAAKIIAEEKEKYLKK